MAAYYKTFLPNNFSPTDDGKYKAVIAASTHQLGTDYSVARAVRVNTNGEWENQLATYKILENGDFEYYVSDMCVCTVHLVQDESLLGNSLDSEEIIDDSIQIGDINQELYNKSE